MAKKLSREEEFNYVKQYMDYHKKIVDQLPEPPGYRTGQGSNLLGAGERGARIGTGAANLVFNILDQPKSAISTGVKYAMDKDTNTDFMSGFMRGITGKEHTSYGEILGEHGVTNPILKGLGGLALDVGLDPLTIVGAPRVKGIGLGEAGLQATKSVAQDVEEGILSHAVAPEVIAQRTKALTAENPYKFQFEVGLPWKRKVVGELKDPPIVQKLRDLIRGPEGQERGIVKAFSRTAEQPFGFADMSRNLEGAMSGHFNDMHRAATRLHNAVSDETREIGFRAYENPEEYAKYKDSPVVSQRVLGKEPTALKEAGINTIGEYVDWVRQHNYDMRRAEMELGLHQNLLPEKATRVPTGENSTTMVKIKQQWNELSEAEQHSILVGAEEKLRKRVMNPKYLESTPGLAKALAKAGDDYISPHSLTYDLIPEKAGLVMDLGQSHVDRMAHTFREQTQAALTHTALQEMGVVASTVEGKQLMDNLKFGDKHLDRDWTPVQRENSKNALHHPVGNLPEYANTYLPRPIAELLNNQFDILNNPDLGSKFMRHADRAMGHWKGLNTVLSPGYFARTTVGDIAQNFADGVWDPRVYKDSALVLNEIKKNQLKDLASTVRDPDAPMSMLTRQGKDSAIRIKIGDQYMTPGEIYKLFIDHGAMSGEIVTERIGKGVTSVDPGADVASRLKFANLRRGNSGLLETLEAPLNKAEAIMSDVNISRETNLRMAHFIDRLRKESVNGVGIEQAAKTAAERVRKFNIDYGGLSSFEKKYMRRAIPFYTFFRKNAPLQLSMLFTNPGFMALYPKTIDAVQNILGTNDGESDWMVPDWIRESMPVRLAANGVAGGFAQKLARFASGASDNSAVFMPLLSGLTPAQDIGTVLQPFQRAFDTGSVSEGFSEAGRTLLNMAHPAIKGTAELAMQQTAQSGVPISDWKEWLAGNVAGGPGRIGYRLSGLGDKSNVQALMSYGLGPQVQAATPERQKSEFLRRRGIMQDTVDKLRWELAKEHGVSPLNKNYGKINSPEIQMLSQFLQFAGKATGSQFPS